MTQTSAPVSTDARIERPATLDRHHSLKDECHAPSFTPTMAMNQGNSSISSLENLAFNDHTQTNAGLLSSPQPLSEAFLLTMQREREMAERAAERAERERAAERESVAAERQLRLLVTGAMMVCATALVCAVTMRSR